MKKQEDSEKLKRTSHLVQVEHLRVWTATPFAEVVRRLEANTGVFDGAAIQARIEAKAPPTAVIEAIVAMTGRSGFMRFAAFDHGAILRARGEPTEAVRFLIGDPLTASRMTKLRIGAALYVPLSLLVAADKQGGTCLEYDRPSTVLTQFKDPGVTQVARELDDKFEALIHSVTDGSRKK
jgi:uncharacterized protein (DUF302 family)